MANEVIVEEYASTANQPIPPQFNKTTTKDIGQTITPGSQCMFVRIRSKGTGFWYSFNGNAAANTDGSSWLPADQFVDHQISTGCVIDTAV